MNRICIVKYVCYSAFFLIDIFLSFPELLTSGQGLTYQKSI